MTGDPSGVSVTDDPSTEAASLRVVGLDLSLRSTGVAVIDGLDVLLGRVESRGRAGASVRESAMRISKIACEVVDLCACAGLVVIEGPSFASTTGQAHERGGLWWHVAIKLWSLRVPIAVASPAVRAKYATGKGNAGKDAVLAATVRRYPDVDVSGNDVADALVLAAMGVRWLGRPVDVVSMVCCSALEKVAWPSPLVSGGSGQKEQQQ